ncbi:RAD9A protein, partial [Grallaria varia]|nr:RAD9A protein [Grallaria varia]
LSRIGDELYLEPTESGLSLRAVNSSRSAFASFLFAPLFFQLYEPGGPAPDTERFRCKVHMKSFLGVFRSLPSLEKSVGKCLILLKPRASRLILQLHCKYGVTKTHNLAFQECEQLQAVFDTQSCSSRLCAPARVLAEAVVHFPLTLAEVTLGTGPGGKISLRNYTEDEAEPSKTMVTELWLAEDEFQSVAVAPGSRITFCLREFRVSPCRVPLAPCYSPSPVSPSRPPSPSPFVSHLPAPSDDFADDLESYMVALESSTYEGGSGGPPSPTFPLRTPQAVQSDPEEEEDEDGAVPGTPPHKKFRSLFFGSVLTPGGPSGAPTQEVLAEDSDGE